MKIRVYITGRYFEDCDINGVADDPENPQVCGYDKSKECVIWDIDFTTGQVDAWNGTEVSAHYKLVDEGIYELIDDDGYVICRQDGCYVPDFLAIDEAGYGDYIELTINRNGFIKGWGTVDKEEIMGFFGYRKYEDKILDLPIGRYIKFEDSEDW